MVLSFNRELDRKFLHKFLFHCNVEEGHGCGTLEDTKNCLDEDNKDGRRLDISEGKQETIKLDKAQHYRLHIKKGESDVKLHWFIEESMLQAINKIIREGIELKTDASKPGVYSNQVRKTKFKKETYTYQFPEDMQDAVNECLCKFNSLYTDAQSESDDEKKLQKLFKACSWFLFEMLDLHPFGDGNGRLCRLLCSYVLSTCTPFPSPIHNVFSDSCLDDFKQALVDARQSKDRHPCSLTTMIIECNFYAWKEFMKEIQLYSPTKTAVANSPKLLRNKQSLKLLCLEGVHERNTVVQPHKNCRCQHP